MKHVVDLQIACDDEIPVSEQCLHTWVATALQEKKEPVEVTLRLVDEQEITELNKIYRQKDKPTNVLAFPAVIPDDIELDYPLLGDVIICPKVLLAESTAQAKTLPAHWAHIVIHGVLHLLGYDHVKEDEAIIMQAQEISLLASLGFANPYQQEVI